MDYLEKVLSDDAFRRQEFPVTAREIYMGHAGVSPFPKVTADAVRGHLFRSERGSQDSVESHGFVAEARQRAATLLGAHADEIALLGPTSHGLGLVAKGIAWESGDEVVYYGDDYPSNAYPWQDLDGQGVRSVVLQSEYPGVITWELVESALTERTKLVALASCNFMSGYRIDMETIGRNLRERGILFSVDAIQTLGAFETTVEHVDFLSSGGHKWLLSPMASGIFYVRRSNWDILKPAMLGAMNVESPDYVTQDSIRFLDSAERYESGALNLLGIAGMNASMGLLLDVGLDAVSKQILELRRAILERLRAHGYQTYLESTGYDDEAGDRQSGIVVLTHPDKSMEPLYARLTSENVVASLRKNRAGQAFLRLSPHFYNTLDEVERVAGLLV